MLNINANYYAAMMKDDPGIVFVYLSFHTGVVVHGSGVFPSDAYLDTTDYPTIIERGTLLRSVGDFEEGDRRTDSALVERVGSTESSRISLEFDNSEDDFAELVAIENPLNCLVEVQHGTPDMVAADFQTIFYGRIVEWLLVPRHLFMIEVEMQ